MFRTLVLTALLIAVAGCATQQNRSISTVNETALSQGAARDAVTQMVVLFPPAQTRLSVVRPAEDAFGRALINGLRDRGYAVQEAYEAGKSRKVSDGESTGVTFDYAVDLLTGSNFYQVQIKVGSTELTRAYVISGGTAYAGGQWVRRE